MFAIDGRISETKIRNQFENDPSFALKFQMHHLQTFGLGDKIDPELARENNKKNIASRGQKLSEKRGLLIDESGFPTVSEKQVVPGRPNSDFIKKPEETSTPATTVAPNKYSASVWLFRKSDPDK